MRTYALLIVENHPEALLMPVNVARWRIERAIRTGEEYDVIAITEAPDRETAEVIFTEILAAAITAQVYAEEEARELKERIIPQEPGEAYRPYT